MSGANCDRRVPAIVKWKGYKPAVLDGLETVARANIPQAGMEVAKLKIFRYSLGVTRMDNIRN